jgi:type IV pilus assembly protein PilZ
MMTKDRRGKISPVVEERRSADRRIEERVAVNIEVDYRASDTFLFAYITDISAMGIFIRTDTPAPKGTVLNLRFRVAGGELMELAGEVIWINVPRPDDSEGRNPGMGVGFRNLTAAQREEVLRMVRTFAYLNDEPSETDEESAAGGRPS